MKAHLFVIEPLIHDLNLAETKSSASGQQAGGTDNGGTEYDHAQFHHSGILDVWFFSRSRSTEAYSANADGQVCPAMSFLAIIFYYFSPST